MGSGKQYQTQSGNICSFTIFLGFHQGHVYIALPPALPTPRNLIFPVIQVETHITFFEGIQMTAFSRW
jgi:hypothetical protein